MKIVQFNHLLGAYLLVTFLSLSSSLSFSNLDFNNTQNKKIIDYSPVPDWVLENWKTRTAASGTWIADNKDYKNEQEPFDAYALQWEYGIGKKHLKGSLYFIKDGKDIGTVWQFTEYWDPGENELKIIQIGSDGTIGNGTIWRTEDGKIKELQKFTAPDGAKYKSGHLSWIQNDINYIESFRVVDEEWTKMRYYEWVLKKE